MKITVKSVYVTVVIISVVCHVQSLYALNMKMPDCVGVPLNTRCGLGMNSPGLWYKQFVPFVTQNTLLVYIFDYTVQFYLCCYK